VLEALDKVVEKSDAIVIKDENVLAHNIKIKMSAMSDGHKKLSKQENDLRDAGIRMELKNHPNTKDVLEKLFVVNEFNTTMKKAMVAAEDQEASAKLLAELTEWVQKASSFFDDNKKFMRFRLQTYLKQ